MSHNVSTDTIKNLQITAHKIRRHALEGIYSAQSGHPGGSLSIADLLAVLYFHEMNVDPDNPAKPDRDRFVLSKGHAAPGYYAALALKGFFPVELMKTLRTIDSPLQGHPDMKKIKGVDMSTGSLGQGISAAVGMALHSKATDTGNRVYTIVGDGELQEGQVWEAAMAAGHHRLDNFVAIIDNNNLQIDGNVDEVMNVYPIEEKFAAFNFYTQEIDGNDIEAIMTALDNARSIQGMPSAIIARTTKGKGVSFMENQAKWHGSAPNEELYTTAIEELNAHLTTLGGVL